MDRSVRQMPVTCMAGWGMSPEAWSIVFWQCNQFIIFLAVVIFAAIDDSL